MLDENWDDTSGERPLKECPFSETNATPSQLGCSGLPESADFSFSFFPVKAPFIETPRIWGF